MSFIECYECKGDGYVKYEEDTCQRCYGDGKEHTPAERAKLRCEVAESILDLMEKRLQIAQLERDQADKELQAARSAFPLPVSPTTP